jgi:hypothetical protein
MINSDMRTYHYYAYGAPNAYGQQTIEKDEFGEPVVKGMVKIAINTTNISVQDNINYKDCSYIGLTYNKALNDSHVIQYGEELLKVLTVNPKGKLKQVFLKKI